MSNIVKHLPWVVPTVAILAVGSGVLDRVTAAFTGQNDAAGQVASQTVMTNAQTDSAQAALAAVQPVENPVVAPAQAPETVAEQLAALLDESSAGLTETADVSVTRNTGFSVDTLNTATGAAMAAEPVVQPVTQPATQPAAQAQGGTVGADFFASAQANLARDRQCIDDLKTLSAQARVYFPSGGLTADQTGIEQARLLGVLAQQCPGVIIQVEGHSDPSGNPVINQRLSLERAEAVVSRVISSGVDASLFQAIGRGDGVPSLVSGPQPQAYYDRRVEFSVVETAQQASLTAPVFGGSNTTFQRAACVAQLETAVADASIEYAPRGMTVNEADFALATQLANIAATCPDARLRIVGQHSEDPRASEDASVGRLRAVVLMTRLVNQGFPAEQLIIAAPSDARPVSGLSDSRVDFDFIIDDL